jgi:hypothetical protein
MTGLEKLQMIMSTTPEEILSFCRRTPLLLDYTESPDLKTNKTVAFQFLFKLVVG